MPIRKPRPLVPHSPLLEKLRILHCFHDRLQIIKRISKSVTCNEDMHKEYGKRLLRPSTTRWLYQVPMLERFIEMRRKVDEIVNKWPQSKHDDEEETSVELAPTQWRLLEELLSFLRPFHAFVVSFQVRFGFCALTVNCSD